MAAVSDETLMAFADGELDAARAREVALAVAADPTLQDTVERLRQSTRLLREVFDQPAYNHVPPGAVRLLAPRTRWRRPWAAAAMAATVVLTVAAFAGGIQFGRAAAVPDRDFSERLLDEVADYHTVYARETEHQVEVTADRQAHIEGWFGAILHRPFHVPDLSKRGLVFAGGRLLVVDGVPVTQLIYRWPGRPHEPFGLCISFGSPVDLAAKTDAREGLQQVLWRRKGYTYVLVGWTSLDFLSSVEAELAPALDPAT